MGERHLHLRQADDVILRAGVERLRVHRVKRIGHAAHAPERAHHVVIAEGAVARRERAVQRQQAAQRLRGADVGDVRPAVILRVGAVLADVDGDDIPRAAAHGHLHRRVVAEAAVDIAVAADLLHRENREAGRAGHQPIVQRTGLHLLQPLLHHRQRREARGDHAQTNAAAANPVLVDQPVQNLHQRGDVHALLVRVAGDEFQQLFRVIEDVFRVVRDGKAFLAHHVAQADAAPQFGRRVHAALRVHCRVQRADGCAEDAARLHAQRVQRGNRADLIRALRPAAAQHERRFGGNKRAH